MVTRLSADVPRLDQTPPARWLNSMVAPTQVTSHGMLRPPATRVMVMLGAAAWAGGGVVATSAPATRLTELSAVMTAAGAVRVMENPSVP